MKKCRDCVHYRPAIPEPCGLGMFVLGAAACTATDFVGDGSRMLKCDDERFSGDERACGREAKHWEAKP